MAVIPVFIMDSAKAQYFRVQTAGQDSRLDPRLVTAGPYVGLEILPTRVEHDPAFAFLADDFSTLEIVQLDTETAWLPEDED